MNNIQTNMPNFPLLQTMITYAILFMRDENPVENILASHFHFYAQSDLEAKDIDMINLGFVVNHTNESNWTVRADFGTSWRGPREKAENLFIALLDLLI